MTRTNIHFGVENKKAQLFLIWVIFWISIWKLSYVLRGKIVVVWKMISDCPNQPNLPRELKTRIAFSMFPILDTNLWLFPRLSSGGKEINHVLTAQTKTEHWSLVEISARLFCFCPTALTITMVNSHRRDNQNYWKLLVFPKAKVLQKNLAGCLIFIGPDMKCVQNKLFAWSKHEVQFFLPNIYNSF